MTISYCDIFAMLAVCLDEAEMFGPTLPRQGCHPISGATLTGGRRCGESINPQSRVYKSDWNSVYIKIVPLIPMVEHVISPFFTNRGASVP